MNIFRSFFSKKKNTKSLEGELWLRGHEAYKRGVDLWLNQKNNEALLEFDVAIENGYEGNVFGYRGSCLQALDFHIDAIEDFNKEIEYNCNDCNSYYSRSVSRGAIFDYAGQVSDLQIAIELAEQNHLCNLKYEEHIIEMGAKSLPSYFQMSLGRAEMDLEFQLRNLKNYEKASPEVKQIMKESNFEMRAIHKTRNIKE